VEKIIEPINYTPQILGIVEILKDRMRSTLIEFTDDQIKAFDVDGILYILANPQLGEEVVLDKNGHSEIVPMYNITLMHDRDWVRTKYTDRGKYVVEVKQPELRILRPDLCFRIQPEGIIDEQ
jgi:hypothetical protein